MYQRFTGNASWPFEMETAGEIIPRIGISKIRLRRKLGIMAAASGWADILGVVVYSAFLVYVVWFTIIAMMNEQEPDFYDPQFRIPGAAVTVYDIACSVLTGALFISVRNRSKPDWQEMFDAPTARI